MCAAAHEESPPSLSPSVFISYASADRAAARALRDTLGAAGLDVWLDEDELGGGEAWDTKIRNQIRTCTYFMPVISVTTELRREGYFRREWRLAVERTLDLADDVMFLVPVVIDDTRDHGARVPDKFFSVQWLRVPGGQATPALYELAGKLATGEAVAIHPPAPSAGPAARPSGQKARKPEPVPPPFPPVPPFPEPGHRLRFCYELILWSGRMIHALWMRLPKVVRVVASIVIVFNIIAWIFRDSSRPAVTKADKAAMAADLAKTIEAAVNPSETSGKTAGNKTIKSLVAAATDALQTGRPLAIVKFNGSSDETTAYAKSLFGHLFKLLQQNAGGKVSVSPLPLEPDSDDDEALARGTRLESRFVLTGFAQQPAPGQPLTFTAKLYDVKLRTVVWAETYEAVPADADATARRIADAIQQHALPDAQP
jgi:TolB-like protein